MEPPMTTLASTRMLGARSLWAIAVPLAFVVGLERGKGDERVIEADEVRCHSFVLKDPETDKPLVLIKTEPRMQAWGVFVLDSKGREKAQLIVARDDDNPQLMFLDKDYQNDQAEGSG